MKTFAIDGSARPWNQVLIAALRLIIGAFAGDGSRTLPFVGCYFLLCDRFPARGYLLARTVCAETRRCLSKTKALCNVSEMQIFDMKELLLVRRVRRVCSDMTRTCFPRQLEILREMLFQSCRRLTA